MSPQAEFIPWAAAQPSDNGWPSQNCVEIGNKNFEAGKWNDIQCSLPTRFICEKSADGSITGKF